MATGRNIAPVATTLRTPQYGYSLAEVMVAMAVFTVVILAALTIYDRSNKVFNQGVQASEMQQSTRVAFDRLVADIRHLLHRPEPGLVHRAPSPSEMSLVIFRSAAVPVRNRRGSRMADLTRDRAIGRGAPKRGERGRPHSETFGEAFRVARNGAFTPYVAG